MSSQAPPPPAARPSPPASIKPRAQRPATPQPRRPAAAPGAQKPNVPSSPLAPLPTANHPSATSQTQQSSTYRPPSDQSNPRSIHAADLRSILGSGGQPIPHGRRRMVRRPVAREVVRGHVAGPDEEFWSTREKSESFASWRLRHLWTSERLRVYRKSRILTAGAEMLEQLVGLELAELVGLCNCESPASEASAVV